MSVNSIGNRSFVCAMYAFTPPTNALTMAFVSGPYAAQSAAAEPR